MIDFMNQFKEQCMARFGKKENVISLILIKKPHAFAPSAEQFDLRLIVLAEGESYHESLFHYIKDNVRIQERWISPDLLEKRSEDPDHTSTIQWIMNGELVIDRDEYVDKLRQKLVVLPSTILEQKKLLHFCRFYRKYKKSMHFYEETHYLDAYTSILTALYHWASIAVLEGGELPDNTVWNQVRDINPGVYKLYEELTQSKESLEKRIHLILLACEFNVVSKLEPCCNSIRSILSSGGQAWTIHELVQHPFLQEVSDDLPMLLERLVQRAFIREVMEFANDDFSDLQLKYTV